MSRDLKPRPKAQKSRSGSRGSTLVGVFVGLVLGAIIAAGLALYLTRSSPFQKSDKDEDKQVATKPAPPPPAPPKPAATDPIALPGKPGDKPVEKPRFDFYNVLPKGTDAMPAPDQADTEKPAKPAGAKPGEGDKARTADVAPKEKLYLQAGAFENPSEADNLKARLALMGVEASVQKVDIPEKGIVLHRVRTGPYATAEDMNAVRAQLVAAGVNAAVVRIKPKEPTKGPIAAQ